MARIGNVHGLLDAMIVFASEEDAVAGGDHTMSELGSGIINLARDLGLPEDKIIDAVSTKAS